MPALFFVDLDDDECVVHQGQGAWYCVRALHEGQPCQSPSTPTPQAQPQAGQADAGGQGGDSGHGATYTTSAAQPTPHAPPSPSAPQATATTQGQAEAGQGTGKATHLDALPGRTT